MVESYLTYVWLNASAILLLILWSVTVLQKIPVKGTHVVLDWNVSLTGKPASQIKIVFNIFAVGISTRICYSYGKIAWDYSIIVHLIALGVGLLLLSIFHVYINGCINSRWYQCLSCCFFIVSAHCDLTLDDPVCGVDGVEYENACSLSYYDTKLAYREPCLLGCDNNNAVCGADGETYYSECAALSAAVLIDYQSPCIGSPSTGLFMWLSERI